MQPSEIRLIRASLPRADLADIAAQGFGDMVKAVVDVRRGIMAVGGELHSDEEAALLDDGSAQQDLWGINLYPADTTEEWIEFDSLINVRPSHGNASRSVEDEATRERIIEIVGSLVAD